MTRCTICGLRTSAGVHFVAGQATFRVADEPVQHSPSTDPRFLLVSLCMAGRWAPAELDDRDAFPSMRAFVWWARHLPWAAG